MTARETESGAGLDLGKLAPILSAYRRGDESALLPVLQRAQATYGYLPREVLAEISRRLGIALTRIYGVVTFYSQFHLTPRGRHTIRCCQGTACHVKGSKDILAALQEALGLGVGETSPDLRFTLDTVACLGTCFLAPAMMIDSQYFGKLSSSKVPAILRQFK